MGASGMTTGSIWNFDASISRRSQMPAETASGGVLARLAGVAGGIVRSIKRSLTVAALACALAVGCLSTRSHAQFGMMSGAQSMPEAVTRRGFDAYTRILGLDADQKEAAKALFEGHQTAYRALQKDITDKMAALGEKARDSGDFSVYKKDMPAMM